MRMGTVTLTEFVIAQKSALKQKMLTDNTTRKD